MKQKVVKIMDMDIARFVLSTVLTVIFLASMKVLAPFIELRRGDFVGFLVLMIWALSYGFALMFIIFRRTKKSKNCFCQLKE